MLKFVLVAAAAAVVVIIASIAWGRFTTAPKPQALKEVEGAMSETAVGQSVAQVFGVSDEHPVEPINLGDAASGVTTQITSYITERIRDAVSKQAIGQIVTQYDKLPEDQREALEAMICKPQ
jgi:hypothetical protein